MNRLYVHLSPDIETARRVAARRQKKGRILIFAVDAKAMLHVFSVGKWRLAYTDGQACLSERP